MIKHIFFFLLLFAFGRCGFTQESYAPGDTLVPGKYLQEDLEYLRQQILATHQAPFTYVSQAEFDSLYDRLNFFAGQGMHYYEFCRQVSLLLKSMKDSHSFVDYKSLVNYYAESGGEFGAFTVHNIDGELYIANDELNILPEGAKLESINGISSSEAADYVLDFAVNEGDAFEASARLRDAIFPVTFPMRKAYGDSIEVCLLVDSTSKCVQYPALSRKELTEYRKNTRETKYLSKFQKKHGQVYKLTIEDDLAIMKIGSFAYGSQGVYNKFIEKSFKQINKEGIKNLAIDLRDNTGGHSGRAEYLLAHLKPNEVVMPANIIGRQSELSQKRQKEAVNGFFRFMLKTFRGRNEEVKNFIHLVEMDSGAVDTVYYHEPENVRKYDFKGNSYLWINGRSASASVVTASNFIRHNIGIIMGESCLGPITGTWGNPIGFNLPNTGIKINLSTIRFNADNSFEVPFAPIQPEIPVSYSPADLRDDNDPYLEKTKELIGK